MPFSFCLSPGPSGIITLVSDMAQVNPAHEGVFFGHQAKKTNTDAPQSHTNTGHNPILGADNQPHADQGCKHHQLALSAQKEIGAV